MAAKDQFVVRLGTDQRTQLEQMTATGRHAAALVHARQCLARRILDMTTLRHAMAAWQEERNAAAGKIEWQFTTADTRTKLRWLYPVLEPANSGVAEH